MNQRVDFIIPECYVDTNLVETLVCHAGCNHQKGCNQVVKVMQEKFSDRFAVGIIDADKRPPSYIKEFYEIAVSQHIRLLRHNQRPHFLILIHPACDGFILDCAESVQLNMSDYELSNDLKEFTSQTKNVMSNKDLRLKKLFNAMKDQEEMKQFRELISYLTSNSYSSDNIVLQSILERVLKV